MWEDILEALTLGGAGAIGGYRQAKELEEARAERERNRMREDRYRQQVLDAQKRQEQREVDREIAAEQRDMLRMGYRQARPDEQVGPMTFQPTGVEIKEFDFDPLVRPQQIRAPEVEGGRIAGTGASASPGQTYSAISRALEEQRPEPQVRTRRVEGPAAYTPARALESATIGDRDYLRVDEELLSSIERDRERRLADEDRAKAFEDAARIAEMEAELQLANQLQLMGAREGVEDERRSAMISALTPILGEESAVAFAYEAQDLTPMARLQALVASQLKPHPTTGVLPTEEQIGLFVEQVAPVMGVRPEDTEAVLSNIMAGIIKRDGDGDAGGEGEPASGVFSGISRRREAEERLNQRRLELQSQIDQISQVLQSGMYGGRPISDRDRRELEAELRRLQQPSRGPLLGDLPREFR